MKKYIAPECEIDAVETKDVITESWYGKIITTTEQVEVGTDPETGLPIYEEQKVANVTVGAGGLANKL